MPCGAPKKRPDRHQDITRLQKDLDNERHARELAERDSLRSQEQLRDARTEIARLREEIQNVRAEGEDAKVRLARIEGERQAEQVRQAAETRAAQQRATAANLRQALARFGTVRESERGIVLVLNESWWVNPRSGNLTAAAAARLDQLGALIANTGYPISNNHRHAGRDDVLKQMTNARVLSGGGLAGMMSRASASGLVLQILGRTVANRAKNRRTEITLVWGA